MTGAIIRAAFLTACEEEWQRCVRVGANDNVITSYFRAIGWQWAITQAGGTQYSEELRRRHPGLLNYCGIGPAAIGLERLGHHLEPGICLPVRLHRRLCHIILPSTYRANSTERWKEAGLDPPEQVPHGEVMGGDWLTVVTGVGKLYGDHFAIATGPPVDGQIPTIEWNATGILGDGTHGRGVVKRTRPVADVRRVYRLDERHIEEGF